MSGRLVIVGLGPGADDLRTPRAAAALEQASDLIGYGPYLERVAARRDQNLHATDNRQELARARHALDLALQGRAVAVVSSGDAGVFAMAAAVFEAVDRDGHRYGEIDIELVPGISAVLAAGARVGAPFGNDFCVISLSDNLKPWDIVVERVEAAARAGFAMALYNPVSKARPWQLGDILDRLRKLLPGEVPVVFATAVSRADECIIWRTIADARDDQADMRTLVVIGTPETRAIRAGGKTRWVYTPRSVAAVPA